MKVRRYSVGSTIATVFFVLLCLFWVMPIFEVLINSFKSNAYINLDAFALPNAESWMGFKNYTTGMTYGNYPFLNAVLYSVVITVASVFLILLFCSMTAWYIARVDSKFARFFYYLCLFSMIVPFQMVMFTLTFTADRLSLNTPWTIPIVYLGFGAGLAIFGEHKLVVLGTEVVKCLIVTKVYVSVLAGNVDEYIRIAYHAFLSGHQILRVVVSVGAVPDGTLQHKQCVGA